MLKYDTKNRVVIFVGDSSAYMGCREVNISLYDRQDCYVTAKDGDVSVQIDCEDFFEGHIDDVSAIRIQTGQGCNVAGTVDVTFAVSVDPAN